MATILNQHTELNQLQISLLRLFNRAMSEDEILKLKKVLVSHYSEILNEELTKVVKDKGYTQQDFDKMLNSDS